MARAVTIGNGSILVGMDYHGFVRDFYYPYVGHSNHVSGASGGYVHRIGVWVDDEFTWLSDEGWEITNGCDESTLIGSMRATHARLGIEIVSTDAVHNERNVFLRSFRAKTLTDTTRSVKLFFSQQFRIFESRRGDTGLYDPRVGAIVHYKGDTTLLVNAWHDGQQFTEYNIGLFDIEGKEGTFKDAEDGQLEGNSIEHGSVDSIMALSFTLEPGAPSTVQYWIAVGHTVAEVHELDAYVKTETPERLISSTEAYWHAWSEKGAHNLSVLAEPLQRLYKRSLTTMRVHTDNRGGIIASSDTDMLHHGRDTYGYVWPRDAALVTRAFDRAEYHDVAKRFFNFISDLLEPDGYLMHKYRVDGTLGSSWHPWMHGTEARLPIQEDETALCVYALYKHYEHVRDLEFIEANYNSFIEPAAQFMTEYVHGLTGLPEPSYDLWEEKYGISTYTACAVYGALRAAEQFAQLLGKDADARTYSAVAQRMQDAICHQLFDEAQGMFVKLIRENEAGDLEYDKTIDMSSFVGVWYFDVLPVTDPRVVRAAAAVTEHLHVQGEVMGYIRYQNDAYYHLQDAHSPNPWVITTLWMAQYYIRCATNLDELAPAYELLEWTCTHATKSGVLAEQMNPYTGEHLSTAPLIWSHAEFVVTVHDYLEKHASLES